jgi:hypothetical protein
MQQQTKTWEIIFYKSDDWNIKVTVIFQDETIWLNQEQIAVLFWVDRTVITKHLKNIFESWEISQNSTSANFAQVKKEWNREVKRNITFYNLDTIIAVWYRVNSYKATKFRIWATSVLKEFIKKGFVMDDERLKNWQSFWQDYFDEWLARIREIRASERRFYQKITDIYATSVDYDPKAQITKDFFAKIQNKFLYAISDKTAPELEYFRADHKKPFMWLTSWKSQKIWWKIIDTDIHIWKNYLSEKELDNLNLLVSQYLDFAEFQARNWNIMTMQNWIDRTKTFFQSNNLKILEWKWSISKEKAEKKVKWEFEKFRIIQDKNYIWDFEKFVEEMKKSKIK